MKRLGYPASAWRVSAEAVDLRRERRAPRTVSFDALPQRLTIDMERTALLVIDMQNDFCTAGGWLDSIGVDTSPLRRPVEPLNALLPALRRNGVPVLWINWGNRPDRMNLSPSILHVYNPDGESAGIGDALPGNGSKVLEQGSWGAAIIDELETAEEDIRVDKYRMSGFWDTPLDSILRNLGADTLLFAGVNLDQCVMHTLQDAACLSYDVVLLADCSATSSPDYCASAALYNIKQCYGFVADSADMLQNLITSEGKDERP